MNINNQRNQPIKYINSNFNSFISHTSESVQKSLVKIISYTTSILDFTNHITDSWPGYTLKKIKEQLNK